MATNLTAFDFQLKLGDGEWNVMDVAGFGIYTSPTEYAGSAKTAGVTMAPGQFTYSPLSFSRYMTKEDQDWLKWYVDTMDGKNDMYYRSGTLLINDQKGDLVATWNIQDAFIMSWNMSPISAGTSAPLVETMTVQPHYYYLTEAAQPSQFNREGASA